MAMNHSISLLLFIVSVGAAVGVSGISSTGQSAKAYWDMKFPNVAMPTLLQSMLPNPSGFDFAKAKSSFDRNFATEFLTCIFNYQQKTTAVQRENKIFRSIFISEEELLKPGTIHQLQYLGPSKSNMGSPFMSRNEVQSKVPFSSQHLSQILAAFSIDPTSKTADIIKSTLKTCEHPSKSRPLFCASSLEDLVDYVSLNFHPSVAKEELQVLGTTVTPQMEVPRRYLITKVSKVGEGKNTISCHKTDFPYGSFKCHNLEGAVAYRVDLQSVDSESLKVNGLAVCHRDTSDWHPMYGAFEVLSRHPGQTVCHFLLDNNIMFIKNN